MNRRRLPRRCAFLLLLICASARGDESFDVIVYGATPGGVAAATAAARAGASVALVEPLPLVGGIMSGGLGFSDSNQTDRRTLGGFFEEFHRRTAAHYRRRGVELPYDVEVKDHRPWTYEPHVAEEVFHSLLREAGVRVFLGRRLVSADKEGPRLRRMKTDAGVFAARVFVDATYEGDLLAAAGVSHALGRESKKLYGESLAGHQFPKPKLTFSPRDAGGVLLPLLTGEDAGPDEGDGKVMVYSWRLCMTKDPANRIPVEKPAGYDPARFELARRLFRNSPDPKVVGLDFYALPGGKADVNNGIRRQLSMGLPGAQWAWCGATPDGREKIRRAHEAYARELLWFLGNDPAVPESLRTSIGAWGFARDEFGRFGHWPPELYVREGRRMIGEQVITQADILRDVAKPDSIGIGSFPIDSHDCQRVATPDGGWVNEGTIFPVHRKDVKYGQPHQLPYRAITPRRAECDNLLVPVSLSASHVAFSSIRVEPTWMVLGQSAGIAAALAVRENAAVQALDVSVLQRELRAAGQILDLRPEHLEGLR